MGNDDVIAFDLGDNQIIEACVQTYKENRGSPDVELLVRSALDYAKTVRGKKPKKNVSLITPIGIIRLGGKDNDDVIIRAFSDVSDETFNEGVREWNYIIGFYIAMSALHEKGILISPYSEKEMKKMLDNSVLFIRFLSNARRKE